MKTCEITNCESEVYPGKKLCVEHRRQSRRNGKPRYEFTDADRARAKVAARESRQKKRDLKKLGWPSIPLSKEDLLNFLSSVVVDQTETADSRVRAAQTMLRVYAGEDVKDAPLGNKRAFEVLIGGQDANVS